MTEGVGPYNLKGNDTEQHEPHQKGNILTILKL